MVTLNISPDAAADIYACATNGDPFADRHAHAVAANRDAFAYCDKHGCTDPNRYEFTVSYSDRNEHSHATYGYAYPGKRPVSEPRP